jgi:molybdopterin converting factor small subunit
MEKNDSPFKQLREKIAEKNQKFFNNFWTENRTVRSFKNKTDPIRRGFSKYVVTPVKKVGRKIRTGAKSIYQNTKSYSKRGFEGVKGASKRIKKSAESGWKKFKDLTDLDLLELNIRETDWPAYRAKKWAEFKTGTGENWKTLKAKARQFPDKVYDEAEDIGQRLGELKENVSKRISSWREEREKRRIARHNENEQINRGGLKTITDRLGEKGSFSGVESKRDGLEKLDRGIDHRFRFKKSKKLSKAVKKRSEAVKKSNRKTKHK